MFRGKILNTFLTRVAFTLKENRKTFWNVKESNIYSITYKNLPANAMQSNK